MNDQENTMAIRKVRKKSGWLKKGYDTVESFSNMFSNSFSLFQIWLSSFIVICLKYISFWQIITWSKSLLKAHIKQIINILNCYKKIWCQYKTGPLINLCDLLIRLSEI